MLGTVADQLEQFKSLASEQLGFHAGHSSMHQLMRFVERVAEAR